MNAKYNNYTLIQQGSGFDLIETVKAQKLGTGTAKEPNGEFYDKEIQHGYNMQMKNAVRKIAHLEMLKDRSTVELNVFIDTFQKLVERIEEAVKIIE